MTLQREKRNFIPTFSEKQIPFLLLALTLLTYAPLINSLGFYWDDWPMTWFQVTQGAKGFAETFTSDRPFLSYLYQLTAALIGYKPIFWQILTVFTRWTVTLSFWWMLKLIWPKKRELVFWVSLLIAVYPGFKQMPIAYIWGNAFIMLTIYVLSYCAMLKAMRAKCVRSAVLWSVFGVACYTFTTISTEYYTGLDFIRVIIIWIALSENKAFGEKTLFKRFLQCIQVWLPYLGVLAIFMFWRVFIFSFPSYQPGLIEKLFSVPVKTTYDLFIRVIEDAYTATWGAWVEFFRFPNHADMASSAGRYFWVAAMIGFALTALIIFRTRTEQAEDPKFSWAKTALLLGICGVILPGIPYWITELPISLTFPRDRFLVAFMFGSSILMIAILDLLIRRQWQKKIILSLFLSMAIGGNILNANSFRRDWQNQFDFVSQLQIRVPDAITKIFFLSDSNPLSYETDNSLTGLVNLALAPERTDLDLKYSVGFYDIRFDSKNDEFQPGSGIYQGFRNASFKGSSENIVAYFYSPPGCLRILDNALHGNLPIFPDRFYDFLPYSRTENILRTKTNTESNFLLTEIFEKPAEENWCNYFQKADLARQYEDWEEIATIGDFAFRQFEPREGSEYFIFIEAYAHMGRWEKFIEILPKVRALNNDLVKPLCPLVFDLFKTYRSTIPESISEYSVAQSINSIGCNAYTAP